MARTGVVLEPVYTEHVMSAFHPESPKRLLKIKEMLEETSVGKKAVRLPVRPATKEELLWVHDRKYIDHIEATAGKTVYLDPDTTASPRTWEAAIMAVGGLISCVEAVFSGKVANAYAFLRPPGHHAEHDRAMGFCIFNNVAIAAEYALKKHDVERVAIIDFDIHHGNGTQHTFYKRSDVFYISTHRWPFYPGTGRRDERGEGLGKGYTLNIPLEHGTDEEFENIYSEVVPRVLEEYRPGLILVSAGYDAHESDPLGGFSVTTEGYNYITERLVEAAEKCCGGRIVFALEGGYDVEALKECAEGALRCLEA